MAQLISRGEISAVEAVEAHIGRIEEMNPSLNAVVLKRYDEALAEAGEADAARRRNDHIGSLHGVPINRSKLTTRCTGEARTHGIS